MQKTKKQINKETDNIYLYVLVEDKMSMILSSNCEKGRDFHGEKITTDT